MKKIIDFKNKDGEINAVEFSVFYTKGGVSWFDGQARSSGFKVSVQPCKTNSERGFASVSFVMFSGLSFSLLQATRNSKNKQEKLFEAITPCYQEVTDIIENIYNDKTQSEIDIKQVSSIINLSFRNRVEDFQPKKSQSLLIRGANLT